MLMQRRPAAGELTQEEANSLHSAPRAAQENHLLSSLRISSEKRNYSCVTLSRFSIWYRTMGYELTSDLPSPSPATLSSVYGLVVIVEALGVTIQGAPSVLKHTQPPCQMSEREEPESDHLKEK